MSFFSIVFTAYKIQERNVRDKVPSDLKFKEDKISPVIARILASKS